MSLERKNSWRCLLDDCCEFTAFDYVWTDLPIEPELDPDTCLCVMDAARNLTLRIEHTETDYIAVAVSTRDETSNDGRPKNVGAWIHLTANIDGKFHQKAFCKSIITDFLVAIEVNALVSDIAKLTENLVNIFLESIDLAKSSPLTEQSGSTTH